MQVHTAESVGSASFHSFPLYSAPPFHLNALMHPPLARSVIKQFPFSMVYDKLQSTTTTTTIIIIIIIMSLI